MKKKPFDQVADVLPIVAGVLDEEGAAEYLEMELEKLRELRTLGTGPRYFTDSATGKITYPVGALRSWNQPPRAPRPPEVERKLQEKLKRKAEEKTAKERQE